IGDIIDISLNKEWILMPNGNTLRIKSKSYTARGTNGLTGLGNISMTNLKRSLSKNGVVCWNAVWRMYWVTNKSDIELTVTTMKYWISLTDYSSWRDFRSMNQKYIDHETN